MTPKRFFNFFAVAEAITWAMLITGMILKYGTETTEIGVRIGGSVHGFVFLCFVLAVILVGVSQRWHVGRILMGLVAAVVPFATIPFEIVSARAGALDGQWGLGADGREPRGPLERLCAWAIRSPWLAAGVGLLVVIVVFTALLVVGPPGS
ncbi:integral membrane protein [Brevibacterium sanguinis]|uniref:Integral membrane protein n=2 Tax=Brevibacterium TaxID=1696 RepID=A0A366INX4_9MICO|nr:MULTISPECIES: DUF3817 domain-containing protein [Brevibacterium]RBP67064.1 integral membrane protein [Brevibacterium sanguinis]RBP73589.1 integral membrane protein [Brevibacterium celere]